MRGACCGLLQSLCQVFGPWWAHGPGSSASEDAIPRLQSDQLFRQCTDSALDHHLLDLHLFIALLVTLIELSSCCQCCSRCAPLRSSAILFVVSNRLLLLFLFLSNPSAQTELVQCAYDSPQGRLSVAVTPVPACTHEGHLPSNSNSVVTSFSILDSSTHVFSKMWACQSLGSQRDRKSVV